MTKARFFDSAYPGSMSQRDDGSYVERKDNESLVEALLQNIHAKQRDVEDWRDSALELEKRLTAMTQERAELVAKLASSNVEVQPPTAFGGSAGTES